MNILFVCRGNTCRSAMAELIAREALRRADALDKVSVRSAGTEAYEGMQMSAGARHALDTLGIDDLSHSAQEITSKLVDWADFIYTMTQNRAGQILIGFPEAASKVQQLNPREPIEDPSGNTTAHYFELAKEIERHVRVVLKRLNIGD